MIAMNAPSLRKMTFAQLKRLQTRQSKLLQHIAAEIARREEAGDPNGGTAKPKQAYKPRAHSKPYREIRKIGNGYYEYERQWVNGVRKSRYIGKAEAPK
jgi:hypothetical protein